MECDDDGYVDADPVIRLPPRQPLLIPPSLHSAYEGTPFTECRVCTRPLRDSPLYEIQKVVRGRECVFELAICRDCAEALSREFSEESLAAIKGFLICNFRCQSRSSCQCNFCIDDGTPYRSYTLLGVCQGATTIVQSCSAHSSTGGSGDLLVFPPIVICEACGESLQSRLSQKTREVQGDFIGDNFPGVPSDLDLSPSLGGLF